ncbi:uncharacterized protein LOC123554787 [Mercenaria mercenaria]|uniref:uncharacterized protein LOC123554787 n=1 Tax=Mercenaria mercenaria TaxID=6596 RepID=UPI00234F3C79|nr:uncharacterized protein LOC123554787 [Mercenaria mercenaria]
MHVSPREGYTIKEKILRALAEGVLMGTNNRLKNKEIQTTVSVDDMKEQHSTMPVLSANESMPTTGQPVLSVKDSMPATSQPVLSVKDSMPTTSQPVLSVKDSMPTTGQPVLSVKDSMPTTGQPVLNVKDSMPTTGQPVLSVKDSMPTAGQPLLLTTNIDTVTDTKYHPYLPKGEKQSTELAVSQETSKSDNAMIYPNNAVVNKQNIPATLEPQYLSNTTNPTTLPPIILPHVTEPTVAVNVSDNGKYLYETTTTSAEVTSLYEFAGTFETTSRQSDVKTLAIQDSTRDSNGLKSTVKPNDKQSWQKTPVATKLFNPESINVKDTFVTENGNIEVQNERRNKSPKIVESLMAGGVMKLPFKTNSNFRFLFSSDSKVKTTNQKVFKKPGAVVKKKAVTDGRRFNELDNNYNANFNTQNDKFSGLETSQLYTEKPKSPDLFRTLRIPTSSTKSFMQRKAELPKKPKRTIDVTEFGDQSLIFSLT